jgi:YqaJ-like viral recombinase domain
MKIHSVIQGSPEWEALRLGRPTGSRFSEIITPGGKESKSAEKLMLELLAERITGHPDEDFKSSWMARGQTMEKDAIAFYEAQRDLDTVPVGFISNDAVTFGVSPDRLVGTDGLLEIKCPKPKNHLGFLLGYGSAYEDYLVQCQAQLWLSERQWLDIVSYNPVMPMALIRVERDEDFIGKMSKLVLEFSAKLEARSLELEERGWMEKKAPYQFSKETDEAFERWQKTGVI